MSIDALVVLMGVGAFLIAFWIDARFPSLAPKSLGRALLHLFAAMASGNVLVPLAFAAVADDPTRMFAGVFGVALPVLVYLFLAGIWLIKCGQGMLGGSVR